MKWTLYKTIADIGNYFWSSNYIIEKEDGSIFTNKTFIGPENNEWVRVQAHHINCYNIQSAAKEEVPKLIALIEFGLNDEVVNELH